MIPNMRLVSCNGLGGSGELGVVQSGFTLVHRTGDLKLGAKGVETNRRTIGWEWDSYFSPDPGDWKVPRDVDFVYGNPPCSGWSTWSTGKFRGAQSKANDHIWKFIAYAGRVAPPVVAFECVQQIFTQGRDFLRDVRAKLEAEAGTQYNLHHVLHNNATVGGAALRKRYFFVASRVPFGIDPPVPDCVPTLFESIGDLEGLANTFTAQPYKRDDSWWSSRRRDPRGIVDGHKTLDTPGIRRTLELVHSVEWRQGEGGTHPLRRYVAEHGRIPESWRYREDKIKEKDYDLGFRQPVRWRYDRPALTATGAILDLVIHPTEDRTLTHREAARIQGWPDTWHLEPTKGVATMKVTHGKGVPVDAGRWLGTWVRRSLEGRPGSMNGAPDLLGDREFVMRMDQEHKLPLKEKKRRSVMWA